MPRPFPELVLLLVTLIMAPAALAQAPPEAFALEARIEASDPQDGAFFGFELAVSPCPDGSVLALTTAYGAGPDGAAYVLRRSAEGGPGGGGAWAEEARLGSPSGSGSGFGLAGAVLCRADGSALALVGAEFATLGGGPELAGAVFAYRRPAGADGGGAGGTWALEDTLVGPAPTAYVSFGFALGLVALADGSALALISAPGRLWPSPIASRVYAFTRAPDGEAWALTGALAGERVGGHLTLAADPTAPGGATALSTAFLRPDSAYVVTAFERHGPNDWRPVGEFEDPTGDWRNGFGSGLTIDVFPEGGAEGGTGEPTARALVGAPGITSPGGVVQAGVAYVFERDGVGAWGLADSLRAPNPTLSAVFGFAVALLDSVALVGARGTDTAAGDEAGAAYHFRRDAEAASGTGGDSGAWSLVERLEAPDGGYLDGYGHAVALARLPEGAPEGAAEGDVLGLVAAAPESTVFGLSTGAVYAYTAAGRPVAAEPGAPVAQAAPLSLAAFPNPARGAATLHLRLGAPSEVAVFDGLGRRVRALPAGPLQAGEHAFGLDLSGLAPGLYLARAAAGAHTTTATLTILP